jgi:hypothetical protein
MSNSLVIGLHPTAPTDGPTFTNYLDGLTITAYELDFTDPTPVSAKSAPPNLIGEAKYDPGKPGNSIFPLEIDVGLGIFKPAAAAEAVIPLPASIDPKFVSPQSVVNVVLDITRKGAPLVDHSINYDVQVFTTPPAVTQATKLTQASLYLALPDPQFDSGDYLIPQSDGTPTPYRVLDKAVKAILAEDPGGGSSPDVTNLTPNDCLHIARELVSNRTARPLPAPLVGTSSGGGNPDLAQLYTTTIGSGNDMDRLKFEGALRGYYNQLDGDAARMARFVYAWSAAQKCQQLSKQAPNAAMTLPVRLKTTSTAGQQAEATLILGN